MTVKAQKDEAIEETGHSSKQARKEIEMREKVNRN